MEESLPGKQVRFKDSESALNSRSDMGYSQNKKGDVQTVSTFWISNQLSTFPILDTTLQVVTLQCVNIKDLWG